MEKIRGVEVKRSARLRQSWCRSLLIYVSTNRKQSKGHVQAIAKKSTENCQNQTTIPTLVAGNGT